VNHDLDEFVLFTDPVVNIQQTSSSALWSLAADGGSFHSLAITVADLKNPASLAHKQLTELGLTNTDFQTILAQDPFANVGTSVTLNRTAITRTSLQTPGGGQNGLPSGSAPSVDPSQFPNRYIYTGQQLSYVPPDTNACTNGVCPCVTNTQSISNALQDVGGTSYSTQYSVSLDVGGLPAKGIGLESDTTLAWTNTATQQNTNQNTQTATLLLACPSTTYTGPAVEVDIWWDAVYGTFLFVPVVDTELVVIQKGVVKNKDGKPLPGESVSVSFGGKTYRTFTDYFGSYRLTVRSSATGSVPRAAELSVKGLKLSVPLRAAGSTEIHIP
jgi:hypothetical protein